MTDKSYEPSPLASVELTPAGGHWTLVFTRDVRHPIAKVWAAITDPDQLPLWSPYTADRNLATAGEATIIMIGDEPGANEHLPAVVRYAEPPRVLEHTWGSDLLRWELAPIELGTRLTLRHTLDEKMISAVAAGWHICLDVADALLAGAPFGPVVGTKAREYGWDDLNKRYADELGIEPAQVW